MTESFATVGDVQLCYETFGDPADPSLLLVMGLATQMIAWPDDFCAALSERGFHVIRFDNRDIGRSTKLTRHAPPTVKQLMLRDKRAAAYTLDDMADDAAGLLDALGIRQAHVVGASMGGMIAQLIAVRHPEKVLSLASIMSNTGARLTGQPSLRLYGVLLRRAPTDDRDKFVAHTMKVFKAIGSPGFPFDEARFREQAERAWERGHDPAGAGRQLAAIIASPPRKAKLKALRVPTVVIHGTKDKLVKPSGGRATARAIPGARLVRVEGMGHDLPREAWAQIIDVIVANAGRAARGAPSPQATQAS